MAGLAFVGVALLQAVAIAASAGSATSPGQPLADRVEVAFRTCAQQLTQRDYLTAKNARTLAPVGVILNDQPPASVRDMASRLFGVNGIYASVSTPDGQIWIAASATVPACKVTVADTALSLTARQLWSTKLRSTAGWTFDKTRSGMNGNFMRDFFALNAQRPGGHMVVILDGPNTVWQDGKGIQTIMTVGLETSKAP